MRNAPDAIQFPDQAAGFADPYAELRAWVASVDLLVLADRLLAVRTGGLVREDVDLRLVVGNQTLAAIDTGERVFPPQVDFAGREGER